MARYAIEKLKKGKFYIVPGLDIKLTKLGAKILPTSFMSKMAYGVQERKLKGK